MYAFLAGTYVTLSFVAMVFFLRFYRESRDQIFLKLAASMLFLGIERIIIVADVITNESKSWVYVLRLIAFGIIIWGMIEKNATPRQTIKITR